MVGEDAPGWRHESETRQLQRYRAAFNQSRDAIMFLDRDGFQDWNQATLTLFGVPDGTTFTRLHPGDLSPARQPDGRSSREAAAARIEEALEGGQAFFEWQHCTWQGVEFPAEVLLSRIDGVAGPVLQAMVRDLSDRKAAFYQLRKFRAAFEQSRDPLMFIDETGYYLDVNPAARAMFAVPEVVTLAGSHPADLSPPWQPDGQPSREAAKARIEEAMEQGQAFFEWRHCTWNGDEFPTEVLLSRIDLAGGP
ncbi:MAG: PAS domain S-box protein, partial [Thiohalospira sp.]